MPKERAAVPGLGPGRAVLVDGTEAGRGLPGFGRNAIERLSGSYAIASEPGYLSVEVWFTREGLLYSEPWRATACPGLGPGWTAYSRDEADGSVLWALSSPGYRLLARFPAGYASGAIPSSPPGSAVHPEPCRFLSALADRFSFFHRYAERPEDVSFPAFLDMLRR